MLNLKRHMPAIARICRKYPVKRLSIFGSALTPEFNRKSDIDLIVEYDRKRVKSWSDAYFDLIMELEEHFKRPVDMMTEGPIRNMYFRKEVEKTRKLVYEG